ncbi:MAG TPA: peptidylprolyl isomerase [Pyrinomonadaceae bacterium]|nr:peptidylprolyl isomerase [Pyrinomonadaceae bacterium]
MLRLISGGAGKLSGRRAAGLLAAFLCLALSPCFSSCGGGQKQTKEFDEIEGAGGAPVKRGVKPEPDAEAAVIDTDYGKIVVELYPNIAPKMVAQFKTLVSQHFYDGTAFHRASPQTGVIQGGDPNTRGNDTSKYGAGDSELPNVPAEFSDIPFDRGIVGAARQGAHPALGDVPELTESQAINTANCQFFITLKRVPGWDGSYTAFGKVIEGINNAQIISQAPTLPRTEILADKVVIKSITLQPRANFGH